MRTLIRNRHGGPLLSQISFTRALWKTQPCDASHHLSKNAQQMANDWFIIHQSLCENKRQKTPGWRGEWTKYSNHFFYGTFNCNLLTTILTMPRPYSEDLQWCVIWLKEVLAYRVNEVAATLCVCKNCWTLCEKIFYFWRSNVRGSWKTEQYDNALIRGVFNHGSSTPTSQKNAVKNSPWRAWANRVPVYFGKFFFLLKHKPFHSEKGLFSFFITRFVATLWQLLKCDKMSFSLLIIN